MLESCLGLLSDKSLTRFIDYLLIVICILTDTTAKTFYNIKTFVENECKNWFHVTGKSVFLLHK